MTTQSKILSMFFKGLLNEFNIILVTKTPKMKRNPNIILYIIFTPLLFS